MERNLKLEQIKGDLKELCVNIGDRHVGSPRNRKATKYVSQRLSSVCFSVVKSGFECIDWEYGNIVLKVGNEQINAFISPYSLSCEIESGFESANNIEELSNKNFTNKIAVLYGDLCNEQLMPKNFKFYNPEHHKQIIQLLEEKKPLAIVAITSRNPELAGGLYPFPLIEDGDFHIPSVYITQEEGDKILSQLNSKMYLQIEARRIPSKGYNVIGTKKGQGSHRIVFCAHIDTKKGTPGALDNGTGVAALLTLADLLENYKGKLDIEILIDNGEDYYANSGEMLYLSENEDRFNEIILAVNTDGAGCAGYKSTFSCFDCKGIIEDAVRKAFEDKHKFIEIEPWYQGDHMLFVMNQTPAVAITSENYLEIMTNIAHTANDIIENIDMDKILDIAFAMKNLIYYLNDKV